MRLSNFTSALQTTSFPPLDRGVYTPASLPTPRPQSSWKRGLSLGEEGEINVAISPPAGPCSFRKISRPFLLQSSLKDEKVLLPAPPPPQGQHHSTPSLGCILRSPQISPACCCCAQPGGSWETQTAGDANCRLSGAGREEEISFPVH